jgi:hypothetical protein
MAVVKESAGKWLEKTLVDLGLDLDRDIISGLVSYCELAQPLDAKEYLLVIPFYLLLSSQDLGTVFLGCIFEPLSLTCNRSLLPPHLPSSVRVFVLIFLGM